MKTKAYLHTVRGVTSIPSLIKWTGSKRSQALYISKLIPPYHRYYEPFLGGGAILYLAAFPESVAGDVYEPLVRLWQLVQTNPDKVIQDYENKWIKLKEELDTINLEEMKKGNGIPTYYYKVRKSFNEKQDPLDLNFLMRTCVNGIVRFNSNGEFNNSFHLSRKGMLPQRFKSIVKAWSSVIQGVNFVCQDYMITIESAEKNDYIYFDPPYAGNRMRYTENLDIDRFFGALEKLNSRGVKWALSFDGRRGNNEIGYSVPKEIYKRHQFIMSGNSAVKKVLNGPVEQVYESLYLNY